MDESNRKQYRDDLRKLRQSYSEWSKEEPVIDLRDDDNVTVTPGRPASHDGDLNGLFGDRSENTRSVTLPGNWQDEVFGTSDDTEAPAVTNHASKQKYSLGVRLRKRLGDLQAWVGEQINLSGEHSRRNKIIIGLGVVATGFLVYKGLSTGGSKGNSQDIANQMPSSSGPKGSVAGEGVADLIPRPTRAPSTTIAEIPVPAPKPTNPEVLLPTPPTAPVEVPPLPNVTEITISQPGQGMWHVLRDQGYNDNQIWRMLHSYADQQGVSYESLNYVELGDKFQIPPV